MAGTSTAVELIRTRGAVLPREATERFAVEQLAVLWEMHAKGCSLQEFAVLLSLAGKYDLDLNAHEIWAVKGRSRDGEPGKLMILVGRDGLLTIARRQASFVAVDGDVHRANDDFRVSRLGDGTRTIEHAYGGSAEDRGEIVGSWAVVRRTDGTSSNYTYTPLTEYVPSYPGWQKSPWGKQVSAMIQKVSVSLCLRIAYGISGVVGEDEVSHQFEQPAAPASESLASVMAAVPEDLRQRLFDAYGEASNLRGAPGVAVVRMAVAGQSHERVEQYVEALEQANHGARLSASAETVQDAEAVGAEVGPCVDTESLEHQLVELDELREEVMAATGDVAEAELDRIDGETARVEALLTAATDARQGRLEV